jgi:hypothetical protein
MTVPGLGIHRAQAAGIYWGAAFAKVLSFGFPMLDVKTFPMPHRDSLLLRASDGGEVDGWSYRGDRFLTFRLPAVPPTTLANPYGYGEATGWDTADGWRDFFAFAWKMNVLRFAPALADYVDGDTTTYVECKLREPWDEPPSPGWNTTREVRLRLRSVEDSFFLGY